MRKIRKLDKLVVMLIFLLVIGLPAKGKIIYVDDDGPADFSNIQAAIDDSNNGDEVVVADGVYTGESNRDIDFVGKAITVRSVNGPCKTIIDCQGTQSDPHRGFYFHNYETRYSIIDGFTITNGYAPNQSNYSKGAGICIENSSPSIHDCIITGNTTWPTYNQWGGGIHISGGSPLIANNLITGNHAAFGGGIDVRGSSLAPEILSTTVTDNTGGDLWNTAGCGGVFEVDSNVTIRNSIIYNNTWGNIGMWQGRGSVIINYSDVQDGWLGAGNINADPLFVDAANGDYHLRAGSPCIDAGDNSAVPPSVLTDIDGNARFVDDPNTLDTGHGAPPIVDMGAYEFSAPPVENDPPIADAGDDIVADANEVVTLDGSKSSDPDGQIIKYTWKRLPDNMIIYSGKDPNCQTRALGRVEEVIELTVTDNYLATATDTVKIINQTTQELKDQLAAMQSQIQQLQQQSQDTRDLVDRICAWPPIKWWLRRAIRLGDLNQDGRVNMADFALFSKDWLQ